MPLTVNAPAPDKVPDECAKVVPELIVVPVLVPVISNIPDVNPIVPAPDNVVPSAMEWVPPANCKVLPLAAPNAPLLEPPLVRSSVPS